MGYAKQNTFDIKPIHALITEELTDGLWIDPFANQNKLATITNDLSLEFDTDYHMDALDFMKMFDCDSVDGVYMILHIPQGKLVNATIMSATM